MYEVLSLITRSASVEAARAVELFVESKCQLVYIGELGDA